jgi:hypothetical protein
MPQESTASEGTERGVRILCDFLTIHGFLTKEGAQYNLAPDSALFLNRHSPAYIGSTVEFLLTSRLREGHARLTEAVRQGVEKQALRPDRRLLAERREQFRVGRQW